MRSPACAKVLLGTLVLSLLFCSCLASDVTDTLCEPGWVFNNGLCYFFSSPNDTLGLTEARDECYHLDSAFVYPTTKGELEFLQSQVGSRQAYGYRLNLLYYSYDNHYETYDPSTQRITYPSAYSLPEMQPAFDKDTIKGDLCIAFHIASSYSYSYSDYTRRQYPWFETVSCSILLKVACQGKTSDFADAGNRWLTVNDYTYWISGELVKYDDAKSLCQDKGMTVVDNPAGLVRVMNASLYDSTPWWSAATVGKNGAQWANGTAINAKDSIWGVTKDYSSTLVLRHTGKAVLLPEGDSPTIGLPYICKKKPTSNGEYGCSLYWMRGGRSCYKVYTAYLNWENAKKTCERQGAHLLTIDSAVEKLWLTAIHFGLNGQYSSQRIWTSGNDISKEGEYKWHDGSKVDSSVFPWMAGSNYDGKLTERCASLYLYSYHLEDFIFYERCRVQKNYPACQYVLRDGATVCADGWKKYKSVCYFLAKDGMVINELNLPRCISESGVSDPWDVTPLMVKDNDVFKFLLENFDNGFYWLGLDSKDVPGAFVWADGSSADMTHNIMNSQKQPNNGASYDSQAYGDGKPENCIATDEDGYAYDENCNARALNYVCERELPVLPSPQIGDDATGGAAAGPRGVTLGVQIVAALAVWAALFVEG